MPVRARPLKSTDLRCCAANPVAQRIKLYASRRASCAPRISALLNGLRMRSGNHTHLRSESGVCLRYALLLMMAGALHLNLFEQPQ